MAKHYNISLPKMFAPAKLNINAIIDFCDAGKPKQNTIINLYKSL